MNLTTIKNALIGIGLLVVVAFLALMLSQYGTYQRLSGALEDQKAGLDAKKQDIEAIKKSIDRYRSEKEDFAKLLFNERDVPAFLDQISQYAKQASISIMDMKTEQFFQVQVSGDPNQDIRLSRRMARQIADEKDKAKNSQTLSAMPIQIKIKGAFPNLVRFLDHLQEYKQMINVSNVVIRQDRSYPLLNCEFVIRIYTLKTMEELKNK